MGQRAMSGDDDDVNISRLLKDGCQFQSRNSLYEA